MTARATVPLLVVALLVAGCDRGWFRRDAGPPRSAETAADALFALADEIDPDRAAIVRVVDEETLADHEVALRDALSLLSGLPSPYVIATEELPGLDRVAVDLEVSIAGGPSRRYSVQASRLPDETYRVVWFEGPGVSWPGHAGSHEDGLTTSPPPGQTR